MKLLVTGAAGCLGRAVVARARAGGHDVRAVDLRSPGRAEPGVEWRAIDLVSAGVDELQEQASGCDAVIHLAALVHRPEVRDPGAYDRMNAQLTSQLAAAARDARIGPARFVFSSTVGVYGRDHDLAATEDTPTAPHTPYAISKLAGERAVLAAGGVVMRFPVMYGPGDRGNIAQLVRAIARGGFALPGACAARRSLIASANAAEAMLLALERSAPGGAYLVTDDDDRSVRVLVETIASAIDPTHRVRELPYAPVWAAAALGSVAAAAGIPMRVNLDALRKLTTPLTFSCARAKSTFGYRPVLAFEPGLGTAVADALRDEVH